MRRKGSKRSTCSCLCVNRWSNRFLTRRWRRRWPPLLFFRLRHKRNRGWASNAGFGERGDVMRLMSVHLSNVRNYSQLDFEPARGLNVFVGENAQGKSNLLEAISLLGTGKSFRTNKEGDLIRTGLEIATISGEAQIRAGVVRLGCTITQTARGTRKLYTVNGQPVRYAKFLGSLKVVTFVPADLYLVAGSPSQRRSFLNVALAQETPLYYRELVRYQKALAQKNAMLRSPEALDEQLLQIYNETLIEAGTKL